MKCILALAFSLLVACGDSATASTSTSADPPITSGPLATNTGTGTGRTAAGSSGATADTASETGAPEPLPCGGLRTYTNAATGTEWTTWAAWEPVLSLTVPLCAVDPPWPRVHIEVVAEARTLNGAEDAVLDLRLIDLAIGEGSPVATRSGAGPSAFSGFRLEPVADYTRTVVWAVEYSPPAGEAVALQLQARGAKGVRIRDVRLSAHE